MVTAQSLMQFYIKMGLYRAKCDWGLHQCGGGWILTNTHRVRGSGDCRRRDTADPRWMSGRLWADTEELENCCITSPLKHSCTFIYNARWPCGKRAWKCTEIAMSSDSDPTGVEHHTSSHMDMFQTRHNNMKEVLWVMQI